MNITIIGAGNMGGALAVGLARKAAQAGLSITVTARHQSTLQHLQEEAPALVASVDNVEAVRKADIVILAVKPWLIEEVIAQIRPVLHRPILCSVAAGIGTQQLRTWLTASADDEGATSHPIDIFYCMPNIAARCGESMTFIAPAAGSSAEATDQVRRLFALAGAVQLCEERLLAPGMMMGGCGIAYVMRYLRAQTEAGVEMGFRPDDALHIAMQTMQGAVSLLRTTGLHPEAAIDQVTTPGGTTIKGLNALDHAGFNSAVIQSLKAGLK